MYVYIIYVYAIYVYAIYKYDKLQSGTYQRQTLRHERDSDADDIRDHRRKVHKRTMLYAQVEDPI